MSNSAAFDHEQSQSSNNPNVGSERPPISDSDQDRHARAQLAAIMMQSVMRTLSEHRRTSIYGSLILKLMSQLGTQPTLASSDSTDAFSTRIGITIDDATIIRQQDSHTSDWNMQYLEDRLTEISTTYGIQPIAEEIRKCFEPGRSVETIPPMFRAVRGGFAEYYLSESWCRCLVPSDWKGLPIVDTAKSLPELDYFPAVPELSEFVLATSLYQLPDIVQFEKCAACSGSFQYSLSDSTDPVTIIKGVPDADRSYKALSYVWGGTEVCEIECRSCGSFTHVPLRNEQTLHHLLSHLKPGESVWLDCVSIDQSDPVDINRILPEMGAIYENARLASAILPATDDLTFEWIAKAFVCGSVMIEHRDNFGRNEDVEASSGRTSQLLSAWCAEFFNAIDTFERCLEHSTYFQRAWTYQEWALARDVEVCYELSGKRFKIEGVKSVIIDAACLWARYIMLANQSAKIICDIRRASAPRIIARIRKMFPCEDFWLAPDEIDQNEKRFQVDAPNISGVEHALGIRPKSDSASILEGENNLKQKSDKLRRRIVTMLNGFDVNQRKARYQADLVACWASMCRIDYHYDKNDSIESALVKVIAALRGMGLQIYNFFISSDLSPLITDIGFIHLAGQQRQTNVALVDAAAPFPDAPVFSGRVDTMTHIRQSVFGPSELFLPSADESVTIRRVEGASVAGWFRLAELEDDDFVTIWTSLTYGLDGADNNMMFQPPEIWAPSLFTKLKLQSSSGMMRSSLCIMRILVSPHRESTNAGAPVHLWAWIICPDEISEIPFSSLIVVRESLNGTLMLLQELSIGNSLHIQCPIGYLTITDHRAGTFLVPTSVEGIVDINLPGSNIPGIQLSAYSADRTLHCLVQLCQEEETLRKPNLN